MLKKKQPQKQNKQIFWNTKQLKAAVSREKYQPKAAASWVPDDVRLIVLMAWESFSPCCDSPCSMFCTRANSRSILTLVLAFSDACDVQNNLQPFINDEFE